MENWLSFISNPTSGIGEMQGLLSTTFPEVSLPLCKKQKANKQTKKTNKKKNKNKNKQTNTKI